LPKVGKKLPPEVFTRVASDCPDHRYGSEWKRRAVDRSPASDEVAPGQITRERLISQSWDPIYGRRDGGAPSAHRSGEARTPRRTLWLRQNFF
jgi:hypothetical protein